MPNILLKRSLTSGSLPTTASLTDGELAMNVPDGRIFLRKSGSGTDTIESAITTGAKNSGSVQLTGSMSVSGSGDIFTAQGDNIYFTGNTMEFSGDVFEITGSLTVVGTTKITGSLGVSQGVTGSLLGTASYAINALSSSFAVTASYWSGSILNATSASYAVSASYAPSTPAFPYTGSALITGSLGITGSISVTQNITGSRALLSGSSNTASGSILTVYGSGSSQPVLTVQGSQGELFSITDSLSGSLFSINDISGLPILEVFSDNTTLLGNYLAPALITTAKSTLTNSGSFTLYSIPTASYDTAFFEYSVRSGSNARAGQIMAIQSGSSVNYTETTTTNFGTTSGLALGVFISGSNMVLTGSASTTAWTIKSIIKAI